MEYFLFEKPEKFIEKDITWHIVKLKKPYELLQVYNNNILNDDCMKELSAIRNSIIESLCNSDSLFSKKPTFSSLSSISPQYFTIGDKKWSPVVKWSCERPEEFKIELVSVYISRSLIVPFFVCRLHKPDVIDLDYDDCIHPDLEEFDGETLVSEVDVVTLKNLKKERRLMKKKVKELFKKAYEAEADFVRKYGELEDDESTFSDSDDESDSSSD